MDNYDIKQVIMDISDFIRDLYFVHEKERIIEETLKTVVKMTHCDSSSLFLLTDNPKRIAYDYNHEESKITTHKSSAGLTSGISERVLKDGEIVVIKDIDEISNLNPKIRERKLKSFAAFPIIIGNEVEGILYINYINSRIPENFDEYSISWIKLFSTIVASAIFDARLYYRLDKALKDLKISFEISRSLMSVSELDELVERIFEEITNRFGYELIAIFIREEKDGYITMNYTLEALKDFIGLKFKVGGKGIVGKVAGTGEPYYAPDVSSDEFYRAALKNVKSEFSIPLKIGNRVIGVLDIESFRLNDFSEDTRNLLVSIGVHIAISLEKARLYERTKRLSGEDPLTGVLNRRRLEEEINREIERSKRHKTKFSLLFMDLDNFKRFNDKYGHLKGDELLISYSNIIKKLLRKGDIFGRYGGDEFVALLYQTDINQSKEVAKRMMNAVVMEDDLLGLTFSIGISGFPDNGNNLKELINVADRACYKAKEKDDKIVIVSRE